MSKTKKYAEIETIELAKMLELILHYRYYFRQLYEVINELIGSGILQEESWDEFLENQSDLDYYSMLGHIDSLEKHNKSIIRFPMQPHKKFLKWIITKN